MKRFAVGLAVFAFCSLSTLAHNDAYFDKNPGPHNGHRRMAGPYHLELVTGKDEITLYVTDHADVPVDTTGGSAKVIISSGKKKRYVVILSGAGDNVLKGQGDFKLSKTSTASVLIALPGQEPQRANFTVSSGNSSKKAHHH